MADPVRVTAFMLPLAGPNATNPVVVRNFLPWLQGYLDQVAPEFRNNTRLNFECTTGGVPRAELFYWRQVDEASTEEAYITRRLLKERSEKEKRIAALTAQIAEIDLQLGGSPLGG